MIDKIPKPLKTVEFVGWAARGWVRLLPDKHGSGFLLPSPPVPYIERKSQVF